MLQAKEHTPIPYPSVVFTFGLEVESIKEFGGALIGNIFIQTCTSILKYQCFE
jgi:hypothetical protein